MIIREFYTYNNDRNYIFSSHEIKDTYSYN